MLELVVVVLSAKFMLNCSTRDDQLWTDRQADRFLLWEWTKSIYTVLCFSVVSIFN